MTPLDLAVAWVRAGGREGVEREALVRSLHGPSLAAGVGWAIPGGGGVPDDRKEHALRLWKAAARRAIATADRSRGPGDGVMAPRVPRMVLVTHASAYRLDRGEVVTITGATLAAPVRS